MRNVCSQVYTALAVDRAKLEPFLPAREAHADEPGKLLKELGSLITQLRALQLEWFLGEYLISKKSEAQLVSCCGVSVRQPKGTATSH